MGYDSGLYFPRHYARLMREQAIRVTRAIFDSNPDCRVLLGVPTYAAGGWSHHAHAENLRMALKGVREGLADASAAPQVLQGVAIFAGYTTGAREQAELEELWLK